MQIITRSRVQFTGLLFLLLIASGCASQMRNTEPPIRNVQIQSSIVVNPGHDNDPPPTKNTDVITTETSSSFTIPFFFTEDKETSETRTTVTPAGQNISAPLALELRWLSGSIASIFSPVSSPVWITQRLYVPAPANCTATSASPAIPAPSCFQASPPPNRAQRCYPPQHPPYLYMQMGIELGSKVGNPPAAAPK